MDYLKVQEPILPMLRSTEKVLARQLRSKVNLISELRQHTPVDKGKKDPRHVFFPAGRDEPC